MPKDDENTRAFSIVEQATNEPRDDGELSQAESILSNDELRKEIMREMGRKGGLKGGKARAESLSAEKRSEIAKNAALMRWEK